MCELPYDEIEEYICDGTVGICIKCCNIQWGVEPDAKGYCCDECGENSVMGIEEAIIEIELMPK